jgi:L-ascorbate metabolism protein UlaG (beta-lactamase superfamily)
MEIVYLGHSSFRLKGKTGIVVTDPYDSKMVGLKFTKVNGDIVTVSHDHADHNKVENITVVKKVIDGPGEYEIAGISIVGLPAYHDDKKGELRGKNIIFVIEIDDIRIAHLGDLGHTLKESILSAMGDIDIVLIPVGGEYTIGPSTAVEVARSIDPRIIIPMHYQVKGLSDDIFKKLSPLDPFLSEMALPVENMSKLNIKKSEIGEDQKIVILEKK